MFSNGDRKVLCFQWRSRTQKTVNSSQIICKNRTIEKINHRWRLDVCQNTVFFWRESNAHEHIASQRTESKILISVNLRQTSALLSHTITHKQRRYHSGSPCALAQSLFSLSYWCTARSLVARSRVVYLSCEAGRRDDVKYLLCF